MYSVIHRVRSTLFVATVLIMAVTALVVGGCNENVMTEEAAADGWLSELIRLAPADYEPGWLYFTNQKKMRDIAGAIEFKGSPSLLRSSTARSATSSADSSADYVPLPWTYEAHTTMDLYMREYGDRVYDLIGVDPFFIDEVIGVEAFDHDTPNFMAIDGGGAGADGLPRHIEELGYHKRADGELTYYQWYEDDVNRNSSRTREDPFRPSRMASLAVLDDRLYIAKKSVFLRKALRVQQGDSPSLYDLKPFRELANAVAPEVVSGFFLKPEFVVQGWADAKTADTLDRYRNGEHRWSALEPYAAVVMGSGFMEEQRYLFIGLHFPDSGAADRNTREFKHRWDTARLVTSPDIYNVDEPLNAFCAPLETRTIVVEDASIMIARCPLTYYFPESRPTFPPEALIEMLVQAHILHFLLPDLDDPALR